MRIELTGRTVQLRCLICIHKAMHQQKPTTYPFSLFYAVKLRIRNVVDMQQASASALTDRRAGLQAVTSKSACMTYKL